MTVDKWLRILRQQHEASDCWAAVSDFSDKADDLSISEQLRLLRKLLSEMEHVNTLFTTVLKKIVQAHKAGVLTPKEKRRYHVVVDLFNDFCKNEGGIGIPAS
jgi:hypothetical protein